MPETTKGQRIEHAIKHGLGAMRDADEVYSGDRRGTVYVIFKDGNKFRVTVEQTVQIAEG